MVEMNPGTTPVGVFQATEPAPPQEEWMEIQRKTKLPSSR